MSDEQKPAGAVDAGLAGLRQLHDTVLDEIRRAPPERRPALIGQMLALVAQAHCTFAAQLPLLALTDLDRG